MGFDASLQTDTGSLHLSRSLCWILLNAALDDYELGAMAAATEVDVSAITALVPSEPGWGPKLAAAPIAQAVNALRAALTSAVLTLPAGVDDASRR